jgi:hypothetical protein
MNGLESRLRQSLAENGNVGPRSMPGGTQVRIRARRVGKAIAGLATMAAFVVGVGLLVPRGTQADRPAGPTGTDWPVVVVGDPEDAYVGPSTNEHVVGDKHVLLSGTVDGSLFSFVGYQSTETLILGGAGRSLPQPCVQIAGPSIPNASLQSPGPYPPGALATTGGVGGYCLSPPPTEEQMGWPAFPDRADLFMRTGAGGGAGVCANCPAAGQRQIVVTGFVTGRVTRLEVQLEDGSVHAVPVETWTNDMQVGAFIFFPPSAYLVGDVVAYDTDGRLLARAPLCGPDDGKGGCDVSPTEQVAPTAGMTTQTSHGFTVTYPDDWMPASEILTPTLTDPREIFAIGTYPLRSGGANCAQYPVNAIEDLGPTDALIWLSERQRDSGSAPNRPADFEAWMNERPVDDSPDCLGSVKDFIHHAGEFSNAGRTFDLYVAYGTGASQATLSELWAILNSMTFMVSPGSG